MSEKGENFMEYYLDMEYEFRTYKHVGWDYRDKQEACLEGKKRKKENKKKEQYKSCKTYTEWKQHVNNALPMRISNYDDLLHFLYLKQYRAEHLLEAVKCILIPLYIAVIGLIESIMDLLGCGVEVIIIKIICYVFLLVLIAGVSTAVLIDKMKKVEFMRDFISIAEEKIKRQSTDVSEEENKKE